MARYCAEIWSGNCCVSDLNGVSFANPAEALNYIASVVQGLMNREGAAVDWTGLRFEVADPAGERVLTVPIPMAMSALARKRARATQAAAETNHPTQLRGPISAAANRPQCPPMRSDGLSEP
jgi:hypothetical protein